MSIFNNKPDDLDGADEAFEAFEVEIEEECEEGGASLGDFTVGDKHYVITFTQKRIDMYERSNKPLMSSFVQNGGAFSLAELKNLTAFGLRLLDGPFVNPRKGVEMAADLIEENGYLAVYERVSEALERDCGFLFKGATS